MMHLREAIDEVSSIRRHMARGIEFRGYGPTTLAITGLLAFAAAWIQGHWIPLPLHAPTQWLTLWIGTAVLSVALIGMETIARVRRVHAGLAMEMLHSAVEHFVPALVAGALLTVVLVRFVPQSLWMLPGLWQMLFSLGVFSSCRFLPKPIFWVGIWYLVTGATCLAIGQAADALAPWEMGLPFGIGQLAVAAILQSGYGRARE